MTNLLKIFLLLLFAINTQAQWILQGSGRSASNKVFYVSNTGDDSNDGKTPSTAWKTIGKVNSYNFAGGSKVLFRRGDVFSDTTLLARQGVLYSTFGSGYKPIIRTGEQLSNWSLYQGSSSTSDTVKYIQNENIHNLNSHASSTWMFYEIPQLSQDGIITAFYDSSDGNGNATLTYALFSANSDTDVGSAIPNTTANITLPQGKMRVSLSNGATLTANTKYFLGVASDGNYYSEQPTGSGGVADTFTVMYKSGVAGEPFPPAGEVTGESLTGQRGGVYLGIEVVTQTGGADTIWVASTATGREVQGGRILNGEHYAKFVNSISDLDSYNEAFKRNDSVWVWGSDTSFYAYTIDGIYFDGNATVDSLDIQGNYRNIVIPNTVDDAVFRNGYMKHATYAVHNSGRLKFYRNKILSTHSGIYNLNNFYGYMFLLAETGLQNGHAIYNSDSIKIENVSLSNTKDSSGTQLFNFGYAYLRNVNFKSTDTLISTTKPINSDYCNYSTSPLFFLDTPSFPNTVITTIADWQQKNGSDANSIAKNIGYVNASGFDLHLKATSYSINSGIDLSFGTDLEGNNIPEKDTADIGCYESPYNSPQEQYVHVDFYISSTGSTNWNDATNPEIGVTLGTLEANQSQLQAGDVIGFKYGDVFENQKISFTNLHGSQAAHIKFIAYGDSTLGKPTFNWYRAVPNWNDPSKWTQINTNRWRLDLGYCTERDVRRLWLDGQEYMQSYEWLDCQVAKDSMKFDATHRWEARYNSSCGTSEIDVWTPGTNPANYYTSIEFVNLYEYFFEFISCSFIDVENLKFIGSDWTVFRILGESSHITLNGIENYKSSKDIVQIWENSDYITIDGMYVDQEWRKVYDAPFRLELGNQNIIDILDGSDYNEVKNSTFYDVICTALFRVASFTKRGYTNDVAIGNSFHHNTVYGRGQYFRAFNIGGDNGGTNGAMPDSTKIYSNYVYGNSTSSRPSSDNTLFAFNIFDKAYADHTRIVLDHIGSDAARYCGFPQKDYGLSLMTDAGGDGTNIMVINNTFYETGYYGIKDTRDHTVKIINNLFINTSKYKQSNNGHYLDLYHSNGNRGDKFYNNFSLNKNVNQAYRDSVVAYALNQIGYPDSYMSWEMLNNSELSNDDANGNKTYPGENYNVTDLLVDPENKNFNARAEIQGKGVDVSSYLWPGFTDYYGNIVVQSSPNVGAVDNKD